MSIESELKSISETNGGLLRPVDVVEFARDKDTALHSRFEWNDTQAAKEYRLWQARQLISIHLVILTPDTQEVRAWVSLKDDRQNPGGGYRDIGTVMRNPVLRETLLREAIDEFQRFILKYQALKELSEVIAAMDKLVKKRVRRAPAPEKTLTL